MKALLTKDLKISFISTKSGSVISEEQGEDLMILRSHVSEASVSSTELEEEYEKLAAEGAPTILTVRTPVL